MHCCLLGKETGQEAAASYKKHGKLKQERLHVN